jgi:hypothetical protein
VWRGHCDAVCDLQVASPCVWCRAAPSNARSAVLFFVDAMTAQPHDPDINGLLRQCNVHNIPVATNPATAELLLEGLVRRLDGAATGAARLPT